MRYRSPMARPSGSARILLSVKSCDTSLMICLINKLDSGVKVKTDEFKKNFQYFWEHRLNIEAHERFI